MHKIALVAFVILVIASATGQQVVLDWSNQASPLVTAPSEVNKITPVTVVVRNVNDVLYEYKVDVTEQLGEADNIKYLVDFLSKYTVSPQGAPARDICEQAQSTSQTALASAQKLFTGDQPDPNLVPQTNKDSKKVASIPLEKTVGTWNLSVRPNLEALKHQQEILSKTPCKDDIKYDAVRGDSKKFIDFAQPIQDRVDKPSHSVTSETTLRPGNKYTITVSELYKGVPTAVSPVQVSFAPATNTLTLSAGVLFTEIQDPTYSSRPFLAPQTGNFLSIENTGPVRPAIVGLLNYSSPFSFKIRADEWLAVSTGPVIGLNGGKNNVSNFGYFAGLSVNMFHLFYITPGVHVGQFADIPPGLSPGQAIPSNYGNLTSRNRWTLRFAVALTYRAKDLSSVTGKSGSSTVTKPADNTTAAAKPKKQ